MSEAMPNYVHPDSLRTFSTHCTIQYTLPHFWSHIRIERCCLCFHVLTVLTVLNALYVCVRVCVVGRGEEMETISPESCMTIFQLLGRV